MKTLAEVQKTVHDALLGRLDVADAATRLGVSAERLALYARLVGAHRQRVLVKNHPVLRSILPERAWADLVQGYLSECPASERELNASVASFPEWLESRIGFTDSLTLFHADLAAAEWELVSAWLHPADWAASTGAVPRVNPTLAVLELSHPVARFLADPERRSAIPAPGREVLLVWRHPARHSVVYRSADDRLLFALKVAQEGLSVSEAVLASGLAEATVRAILAESAEIGLVSCLTNGR